VSFAVLLIALVATIGSQEDDVPLYDNLGTHHMAISTAVPVAQQYFDQGLRLTYGFNHGEAIRAFTRAAQLDPTCAMCYWGIAYAYGPNINASMDSASGVAAYEAVQRALALQANASQRERAYIRALATRYAPVPPANRAALDSAFAHAMGEVATAYPEDLDAATIHAEARMNLRPWNYWQSDGTPYPGSAEIVSALERVIASEPNHPGACHYYIHAVEAVQPELAVPCAERLAALMPGAGHMVHMPGHIYIRVGRYADAIQANEHAIHTDEVYIEGQRPTGVYPIGYYPHNIHFLAFAATLAGRSAQAIEAARNVRSKVNMEVAAAAPDLQEMVPYDVLTLVTFGRWPDVLTAPLPPSELWLSSALAHYARGVAFAATRRRAEAEQSLAQVRAIASATDQPLYSRVLEIALHALQGEIELRNGNAGAAIPHFEMAAAIEDDLLYFEPPKWYYPIRHSLGAALLRVQRYSDAERVYREDLQRFPLNGWSLFGLAEALRAQGRTAEAATVDEQFRRAWLGADVTLTASRF
jgi:tetratricopeptide (TPR) repeat protein